MSRFTESDTYYADKGDSCRCPSVRPIVESPHNEFWMGVDEKTGEIDWTGEPLSADQRDPLVEGCKWRRFRLIEDDEVLEKLHIVRGDLEVLKHDPAACGPAIRLALKLLDCLLGEIKA